VPGGEREAFPHVVDRPRHLGRGASGVGEQAHEEDHAEAVDVRRHVQARMDREPGPGEGLSDQLGQRLARGGIQREGSAADAQRPALAPGGERDDHQGERRPALHHGQVDRVLLSHVRQVDAVGLDVGLDDDPPVRERRDPPGRQRPGQIGARGLAQRGGREHRIDEPGTREARHGQVGGGAHRGLPHERVAEADEPDGQAPQPRQSPRLLPDRRHRPRGRDAEVGLATVAVQHGGRPAELREERELQAQHLEAELARGVVAEEVGGLEGERPGDPAEHGGATGLADLGDDLGDRGAPDERRTLVVPQVQEREGEGARLVEGDRREASQHLGRRALVLGEAGRHVLAALARQDAALAPGEAAERHEEVRLVPHTRPLTLVLHQGPEPCLTSVRETGTATHEARQRPLAPLEAAVLEKAAVAHVGQGPAALGAHAGEERLAALAEDRRREDARLPRATAENLHRYREPAADRGHAADELRLVLPGPLDVRIGDPGPLGEERIVVALQLDRHLEDGRALRPDHRPEQRPREGATVAQGEEGIDQIRPLASRGWVCQREPQHGVLGMERPGGHRPRSLPHEREPGQMGKAANLTAREAMT
jgi:hypothetical protein